MLRQRFQMLKPLISRNLNVLSKIEICLASFWFLLKR